MHANVVPAESIAPDIYRAWCRLAERALEANPFFEPDFVLPAKGHLAGGEELELLVVQDGRELRACVPVCRVPRWRKLHLSGIASWRHPYCFLGTPLLDRETPAAAVDALLVWLKRSSRPAKFLALEWLTDGPVMDELAAGAGRVGLPLARMDSFERALLVPNAAALPADEDAETWRRLARRRRALEREHGPTLMTCTRGDTGTIERFLAAEASGWKGEEGTAMACRNGDAAFFREMSGRFAAADRIEFRSFELADGATLAMSCRLTAGDESFCFKVGYDESYRKYAPGLQLEVDTLEQVRSAGSVRQIDSCSDPDNTFFNRLFPQRRVISTVLLAGSGVLGKLLVQGIQFERRLSPRRRDKAA